ncbi:MAG: 50S ribosomal protein L9 [Candidatus Borkfalkiaceae bacterium]|nr:50S ribosomal protein L9 [Christensenellaceae bacterium]
MKVILLTDVKGTGKKDDIVEVSDGFARNCLFRKKQAIEATSTQINSVQNKKKAEEFHKAEELKKWKEVAASLNKREVTCYVRVGGNGKIFGSVTSKEISEKLNELGFDVDKKKILLKEPVKTPGNYVVDVKFLPDVTAKITVKVKTEE